MFTGLVRDIATIVSADPRDGLVRLEVESGFAPESVELGASILHSGVCLSVVETGRGARGARFMVEAVPETLDKTVIGDWAPGSRINLEPSLKLGDELGGHFVFGHVDGLGEITAIEPEGGSYRVTIRPPGEIARYFATKGSVAVDGISLTVADVLETGEFQVAVIPPTWDVTTLQDRRPGDRVNLEIDMLARYVARMIGADQPGDTA